MPVFRQDCSAASMGQHDAFHPAVRDAVSPSRPPAARKRGVHQRRQRAEEPRAARAAPSAHRSNRRSRGTGTRGRRKLSRIARVVASAENLDRWEHARLLALANMAMADGFIAGWTVRYNYDFWRPVTAIRLADSDGNPATAPDPSWETFLNTPPIPDYQSTHSVLGGAAAAVLTEVLGSDRINFTMVSGPPFRGHLAVVHQLLRRGAGEC